MSCVSYPLYPFYTIVGCTTRNLCIVEYNGCILRTIAVGKVCLMIENGPSTFGFNGKTMGNIHCKHN